MKPTKKPSDTLGKTKLWTNGSPADASPYAKRNISNKSFVPPRFRGSSKGK